MRYIGKSQISIVTMSILICLIHIAALPMVEERASAQQQTVTNADGSTITTGIRDERYGKGGTRDETKVAKGSVVEKVWKDRKGQVWEREITNYGIGNEKKVWRIIHSPKPEGGTVRSKQIFTETDLFGNEILEETWIYNENGDIIDGLRSEVLPNRKKKTSRWDPKEKRWVEVAATARPGFTDPNSSEGQYIGCFMESNRRALNSHQVIGDALMTNARCRSLCKSLGFSYAGTEYGQECYCGNKAPTGRAAEDKCNYKCKGNEGEFCGGFLHISVFRLQ